MRKVKKSRFDFIESNLPSNRKEVFFDCLKLRFGILFKLGILIFIFFIPLFLTSLIMDVSVTSLYENMNDDESIKNAIIGTINLFNLINIPLFVILSLGFAGAFRVVRQLVWGEPIFFSSDFMDGIKLNGKGFSLCFLIVGIVNFIISYVLYTNDSYNIISFIPLVLTFLIFIPIGLYVLSLYNTYNITFKSAIYNGLLLYVKELPKTLLFTLIVELPFAILLISDITKYLIALVAVIFIIPLLIMAYYLFSCYVFDKHINAKSYPEYVDKGIRRKQ